MDTKTREQRKSDKYQPEMKFWKSNWVWEKLRAESATMFLG